MEFLNFTNLNYQEIVVISIIMIRCFAILIPIPYMENAQMENRIKAGVAFFIAIALYPSVRKYITADFSSLYILFTSIIMEVLLGLFSAFCTKMLFGAIQLGGSVAGMQMALGAAQAFDPTSSANLELLASFLIRVFSVVFLVYNFDHFYILALKFSFSALPVGGFDLNGSVLSWLISISFVIPYVAFQAVAPIIAVIFLVQTAFGLVSKSVPQINIYFISSIITIFIGMAVFFISLPYFVSFAETKLMEVNQNILILIRNMN